MSINHHSFNFEGGRPKDSPLYKWALDEVSRVYNYRMLKLRALEGAKQTEEEYAFLCDLESYTNALNVIERLITDRRRGESTTLTVDVLTKLLNGRPLTPIYDTPDVWTKVENWGDVDMYRCTRYPALFKYVYSDGTCKFVDIDAYLCTNVNAPTELYGGGFIQQVLDKLFPISCPYMPTDTIKVYCAEDYDKPNVLKIFHIVLPSGKTLMVNRHFKLTESGPEEITLEEYLKLKGEKT